MASHPDQGRGPGPEAPARRASPRPTFDGPTHIPFADATRHVWGDDEAGLVDDWIYVSSERIHHLVFGLPPGGAFRHSDANRTIFAADEVLHVLQGTLVLANPETGEAHVAETGESVFFRRDTWHHGYSFGTDDLRVLEFFAPPPASGASSAYARSKPYLEMVNLVDHRWVGRWPMASAERAGAGTMRVLRDDDVLWTLDGPSGAALLGVVASTEHLLVARLRIRPGAETGMHAHPGADGCLHVVRGRLRALVPDAAGPDQSFDLDRWDGFYVPAGVEHRYRNDTDEIVEALIAVAPGDGWPGDGSDAATP